MEHSTASFLMKKNAEILFSKGRKYVNNEQDLGVEKLRQAKERYRPCLMLKKYKLTYNQLNML